MMDRILDRNEAAEYLHTTVNTLASLAYRNTGPRYFKPTRKALYKQSDLDEWLEKSAINPAWEAY